VEKRLRTTGGGATGSVRNLRIREDTAKYLLNLDINSAHYDPKTRSMRADPLPHKASASRLSRYVLNLCIIAL
jgi:pre-mRNA-processing factor SLU7